MVGFGYGRLERWLYDEGNFSELFTNYGRVRENFNNIEPLSKL